MPVLPDYHLQSPAWWITAVFLAILINIASMLAMRGIDRWGGQISANWSTRTAAKKRRTERLIAAARGDVNRLIWLGFQAQSIKTTTLLCFGFSTLLFLLAATIWLDEVTRLVLRFMGALVLMLGVFLFNRAADLEAVIRAVEPEWPEPSTRSEETAK